MNRASGILVHVDAPHFCAGLELDRMGTCVDAAPILRWAIGRRWVSLDHYFKGKGWKVRLSPFIQCPKCRRRSFHPKDIEHRFCGACGYHDEIPSA